MQFCEPNQIAQWRVDHGVPEGRDPNARVVSKHPFGQAAIPKGQEAALAAATLDALGAWDECLLVVKEWGIWPSSEDWPAYYQQRGAHGERRSLGTAPGHLARSTDRSALLRFLELVLENAWGGEVIPISNGRFTGRRAFFSHDEFIELVEEVGVNRAVPAN